MSDQRTIENMREDADRGNYVVISQMALAGIAASGIEFGWVDPMFGLAMTFFIIGVAVTMANRIDSLYQRADLREELQARDSE
jgi:divalent metal cation (Fe/Co/Zn/Cd) transporter